MAAVLAELVSVPTENPPGRSYRGCVDLLEKKLGEAGLTCERHQFPLSETEARDETAVSLLAAYGRGERTLHFHGHYDVVPAQSDGQFQPERKEHFVFGRGSCDMKGGIVSMLYAIRAVHECGAELNGKIMLTLVPDEETGGARGSAWLAKRGLLGRDGIGMLLPEPTSGVVWNANRGAISLRVKVLGKSAHVGLQHQGENAFERMLRVVERLQGLKREVEQRKTGLNIGAEQLRNSVLMLGGESGGGANFNVVPEQCWFTVDRRINPEEDLEKEKMRVVAVLEECRRDGIPVSGRSCRKATRRRAPQRNGWGKRWRAAWKRLPAKRRDSRCAPACWRFASMPVSEFRRTRTVPACSPSRTDRTNMWICEKCATAQQSTR